VQEICGANSNVRNGKHNTQYAHEDNSEIIKYGKAMCWRRISKYY
jgi:hypothetical protein